MEKPRTFFPRAFSAIFFVSLLASSTVSFAEEVRYDSGNRRDPFIPLVGPEGIVKQVFNPSGLNVEGIIFDPLHGSLALVNGEFYREKDKVGQATLVGIYKDHVVLQQEEERKTLWLREDDNGGKKNDKKSDSKPETKQKKT